MPSFLLGDQTPEFILSTVKGEEFSFNAHKDSHPGWQLIVFFRGSWCSACIKVLKDLQQNISYFNSEQIHITAISTDNLKDLTVMAEELGLTFPVLADEKWTASKSYEVYFHTDDAPFEDTGSHGEPAYFLINEQGQLLYQQRQTNPYGRPTAAELKQVVKFIHKKLAAGKI